MRRLAHPLVERILAGVQRLVTRSTPARALGLALAALGVAGAFETPKQVKVLFEFRQEATEEREDLQGRGSIVIGRKNSAVGGALAGASTDVVTHRSTGLWTVVQDGGSSLLSVSTRLPYEEVVFFRDYLTGSGYVASGVVFENVGTRLRVSVQVLDDEKIRVRLEPSVSWVSPQGSGAIDVTEAASELVVRSREPITLGGATTELHELTRRILGLGSVRGASETTLVLTASIL